jgi:hypothetical protein
MKPLQVNDTLYWEVNSFPYNRTKFIEYTVTRVEEDKAYIAYGTGPQEYKEYKLVVPRVFDILSYLGYYTIIKNKKEDLLFRLPSDTLSELIVTLEKREDCRKTLLDMAHYLFHNQSLLCSDKYRDYFDLECTIEEILKTKIFEDFKK